MEAFLWIVTGIFAGILISALVGLFTKKVNTSGTDYQKELLFTDRAIDSQEDTLFIFEPQSGMSVRWNRSFREVSGYSDEEIATLPAPASYYSEEDVIKAQKFITSISKRRPLIRKSPFS